MKPNDISYVTFLKKLQIILINLHATLNYFIKISRIGDVGGCKYCFE